MPSPGRAQPSDIPAFAFPPGHDSIGPLPTRRPLRRHCSGIGPVPAVDVSLDPPAALATDGNASGRSRGWPLPPLSTMIFQVMEQALTPQRHEQLSRTI